MSNKVLILVIVALLSVAICSAWRLLDILL